MADNVDVTEGAGKTIASDDVGGAQYQRVKLDLGTDGAAAPALAGAGAVATGVQRVTLASDDPAVALLTTIDSDTNTIQGDTTTLAGAVAGSEMQVDIVADGAGLATDAKLDTIITAVQILDDWDDGDYCNSNMNIAGTDVTGDQGNADAQTIRVAIADDDTLLTTIDADTGAIKTAVEIIDDWDAVHDSAASADGPQMMAAYDSTKPTAVADGDAVRVLSDEYGRLLSGVEKTRWQAVYDSADASGEGETVYASAASTIVVVQSYIISSDTELWVKLQEEDSTAITGKFWLKAGGGVAITLPDKAPLVLGVDSDLEVITEGAGDVSVSATGYTIPG